MKTGCIVITVFLGFFLITGAVSAADVSFSFEQGNLNTDDYLTVKFTGLMEGKTASNDSQWEWNFGDGTKAGYGKCVTHTYSKDSLPFDLSQPIEFMIGLSVTTDEDSGEEKIETSRKITLAEPSLSATFSANVTSGTYPMTVLFEDKTHGRHRILEWDFADLSDKPAISPVTHVFETDRTYPVKLVVGRGPGEVSTAMREIVVRKPGPVVSFSSDVSSGRAPLVVHFTDNSVIDSGEITERLWDFGDESLTSDAKNPKHVFSKPGEYLVVLTVTGNEKTASDKMKITVKNLEASFSADKTSGTESLSVSFTSDSKGDIETHYWNFGDGHFSTEQNPVHIFHNAGVYDISLTVSGPLGSDMKTRFGYIEVFDSDLKPFKDEDSDLDLKDSPTKVFTEKKLLFGISGTEIIMEKLDQFKTFILEIFSITRETGEDIGENIGDIGENLNISETEAN